MNYTTYLFDFDYTLADSSRGIVTCFHNVLNLHGYTQVTDDDIKHTIGKTLEESFSILTGVTDAGQLAAFKAEYRKEADTHMTVNTRLFLETKSVLTTLKDSGARLGIISTKYRFRIRELLDRHFPADFMDIIVGGEDVKAAKPSPEGLLFAIKQLHVSKAETLYIGDSTVDAETALAAGVDFAGVTHGVTTAKELAKYPHRRIMSTLEELLESEKETPSGTEENLPAVFEVEKPIQPENTAPTARHRKKLINIWQTLLLAFLLWLSWAEGEIIESVVFLPLFLMALWGILRKRTLLPDRVKAFIAPWWMPYGVRLRAFHIKLIRGREPQPVDDRISTCLNCGTTYTGNFCHRCGQSRTTARYRLSNALRNITGGFFNIDSGFGRTLFELLYRPGYMIRDFIGGKRAEYFRPFQTLFVLAALYIMAVQLVDPEALNRKEQPKPTAKEEIIEEREELARDMEKAHSPKEKKALAIAIKSLDSRLEEKVDSISNVAQSAEPKSGEEDLFDELNRSTSEVGNKLESFLQDSPFLQKVWGLLKSWGHGNKAFRIIATLPLFALATQLAFRRRKYKLNYNTTEHIFIQAYIACQILLLSIVVLPFNGQARVSELYELPLWAIFFLFCWDYKQLYRCTWWKSFWRTVLMLFYSLVLIVLFAIFVMALMLAGVYLLKLFL